MRRVLLLACLGLPACMTSHQGAQKLADGTWSVTCGSQMDECVRRAQEACPRQRFRILEGVSETRVRDAPPYEQAYHTSRLRWVCTNDGATPLLSLDKSDAPSSSSAPAPAPRACTPGLTRECVGSGACRGGQACLADGSGFGPCDCGPAAPSAAPAPVEPPSAPEPAAQ